MTANLTLEMEENGYTKSEVLKRDVQVQYSTVQGSTVQYVEYSGVQ